MHTASATLHASRTAMHATDTTLCATSATTDATGGPSAGRTGHHPVNQRIGRTGFSTRRLCAELFDQLDRHGLGNDRLAALGLADGGDQRVGLDVLGEVAHRAGLQRLGQFLTLFRHGENDYLRLRHILREQVQGFQPRQARHVQVEQDHVRAQGLGALEPLQPVGGFGHDLQIGFALQQLAYARAKQVVIVDKQNADAHADRSGQRRGRIEPCSMTQPEKNAMIQII